MVVDYKTGRSVLTDDDARGSMALALYALGTRRTFRRSCSRVELHQVSTGRVLVWEHTPESLDRHIRRAEQIALEASAAIAALSEGGSAEDLFPARPGRRCGWCDFVRVCPVGMAASGGPRKPWAGLAEERVPLSEDE